MMRRLIRIGLVVAAASIMIAAMIDEADTSQGVRSLSLFDQL